MSQSGSYISGFMIPSNVILFPKHLSQSIRGNSVLEINTDAGENSYYHYRNIPTYIKDGTDALVGHESNPNRDDLFKDIDANVIVSRN